MFWWRMRSVLLLSLLVAVTTVVRSEQQPNPAVENEQQVTTGGSTGADEEVQNRLATGLRLEHELVKEQADAPSTVNGSSEGGIVAIHVDAVGGKEQLRPTLRGLSYLATKFLPREYKFVEILSATREVVAGVRYELIVGTEEEANAQAKHVCRLVILEKPWITTEYGEKYRTLEYTNCTTSGDYTVPAVEVVTQLNPAFDANLRATENITPQREAELEQQIIVEKVEVLEMTSPSGDLEATPQTPSAVTTESEGLSDAAKAAIDDLFSFVAAPQTQQAGVAPQTNRAEVIEETIVPIRITPERSDATASTTTTTTLAPLDQQVQSTFDEVFKTHQEIQKALDEVIANGGGRDAQLKYRPVFDSLLQKVKASIDNYYRTTNDGDANVDTAAFVVRDNAGFQRRPTTVRPRPSSEQSSAESDESNLQQKSNPLQHGQQPASPELNLRPPKVDAPTATFAVESDEEEDGQQILTKEQLIRDLNEDDGLLQRVKKRSIGLSSEELSGGIFTPLKTAIHRARRQPYGDHSVSFSSESYERRRTRPGHYRTKRDVTEQAKQKDTTHPKLATENENVNAPSTAPTAPEVVASPEKTVEGKDVTTKNSKSKETAAEQGSFHSTSAAPLDKSTEEEAKKLTKEELAKELNADEGHQRNKRDFSGGFSGGGFSGGDFGGYSGGSFGGGSYSGGGYYGGGYYGGGYYGGGYYNPYRRRGGYGYRRPYGGYYGGYYRGKRSVHSDELPADVEIESEAVPTVTTSEGITSPTLKPAIPQAPVIEGVTMTFGDSEEDDSVPSLTKEQLTEQLNADDGLRRDKRGYSSSFDYSSGGHSGGYYRGGGYYGVGYYQHPSYYNRPPPYYYGHYRGKRSSTNSEADASVIDLNDPVLESKIKAIAQDAIVRLDQMDADAYQRMLLEVLEAKKVSERADKKRSTYVLTLLTANSHCAEGESKDSKSCRDLLMADTTKQCTLEVHVVKSNDDDSQQVQVTKSKCQKQQSLRQLGGLVGGAAPVDLSEPEHAERIRAGLVGYENGKHSNFEILQGTVQIVAGTIHRYKIALKSSKGAEYGTCDVEIFTPLPSAADQQPKYEFDCQQDDEHHHRRRREEPVPPPKKLYKVRKTGGAQELTPEEYGKEEHQMRIRTGLQQLSALANANGVERKVKIVSASQQLVAGKSYTYRLTFPDDEEKRVCKLTVWEKPWLKEKAPEEAFKATFDCGETGGVKRTKRSFCAGCPSTLPPEEYGNSEHQERINKILSSYGVARESSLKVINATSQVVAGIKYTYFVEQSNGVCKLTSWERAWLAETEPNEAYKYTYECTAKTRKRRSVPGGIRSLTKDELTDTEHVQRVDKILVSNGGAKGSSARIVGGTVQIVAGKLYKYAVEFDLTEGKSGSSIKVCKLSSWERPWLEKTNPTEAYKYTVACPDEQQSVANARKRRHAKKVGSSNELTAEELKDRSHVERIQAGMVTYNAERSKAYSEFEILAGSTQQVVGSLYKYTFRVTSEPDIVCKISIWERVWLEAQDQRKYNVKCTGDDDTEQQPDAKPQQESSASTAATTVHRRSVRSLKIDDDEHVRQQFEKFKIRHQRQYASSMEHEMRFNIFRNNLFKINQLNQFERGTAKYGVTKFADMTTAEYRAHTGLIVPKHHQNGNGNHIRNPVARDEDVAGMDDLPESFDWRDHGAVTNVKDQGSCGSCWAFSAIANIEGQHQIKTGKLESYSEQELLDCDKVDNGCGGGYMDDAFKAIETIGGLELESDYPYRAKKEKSCQFNKTLSHVQVKGAVDMPKNETFIAQYLVKNGPIAIGLNANAMQFYRGGISHPWHPLCSHKSIDHGVLIVGYGVKEYPMFNKTLPYWIIKNSWGPKWGEQGYYRIFRGDNSCGVSEMASSAIVA